MVKPKRNNQDSSNQTSSSNETSVKSKIKAFFSGRSRSSSPIPNPTSSRASDSHQTGTSSLPRNRTDIDSSTTTGISANLQSSVQQTLPLIRVSESEFQQSTYSESTENRYSTIMFGETSQPTSLGSRVVHSMAYQELKTGIETIKSFSGPFPPLKALTEGLLRVMDMFETVTQNEEDRAKMISKLTAVVDLLQEKVVQQNRSVLSSSFNARVARLKKTLDSQIRLTEGHRQRSRYRRVVESKKDSSEIAAFHNVLLHAFDVFLIDTALDTELTVEKILMNQLFQELPRAKNAAYNSASEIPRNGCTVGTREDIMKKLVSWATDETNKKVYWLNGMAGTGKTTIAYSFCEKLEERGLLGASFFCSRSEDHSSDAGRIFPTIAYELSRHLPDISSVILLDSIENDHDVGSKRLDLQFSKLIVDPMMAIPPERWSSFAKIVVLDALDECKNQNEIAAILSLLSQHVAKLPIKFFITSRPTPEIEDEFRRPTLIFSKFLLHEVERDMVEADIRLYAKEKFKEIAERKLGQVDDAWPSEEEITVIVERAGVLFIYAATICMYVRGGHREGVKSRLQEVISNFSGNISAVKGRTYGVLDDLYRNILDTVYKGKDNEEIEDIKNVLHVVMGSRHPLSPRAIGELLKVNTIRVSTALSKLHSVISSDEESGNQNLPIAPLHASFPDFLGNNERAGKHYLDPDDSQMVIGKLCLRMMQDMLIKDNICGFNERYTINDHSATRMDAKEHISDGLEYACTYWASHVTVLVTFDVLNSELMDFFDSRVLRWIECMSLIGQLGFAVKSLQKLEVRTETNGELWHASMDGRRFLLQNFDIIQAYPLETYNSGLVWLPKKSRIKRVFPGVEKWQVVCGLEKTWDACESVLKGHTDFVFSVEFSHDGNRVVSGSADETVRIWNVETGEEERKLEGHSFDVIYVAFSHDGKKVVSGSRDETIRIWNVETGAEERKLQDQSFGVIYVAFSHDKKMVVSVSDARKIMIWDLETGEERKLEYDYNNTVTSVAFSQNGNKVVFGTIDSKVRIWNVKTGEEERKLQGHSRSVSSVAFSHDGKKVVSGSYDRTIRIWNVETGEEERKLEGHFSVSSVAFSHDGKKVVSGSGDNTIRIWNVEMGEEERKLEGHSESVSSVSFSHDGKKVVSGSGDKTIRIWNVETGEVSQLKGHLPLSVGPSHHRQKAVPGSDDRTVRSVETGEEEMALGGHLFNVKSVEFSHDEKRVVCGYSDGTIRIWNAETGEERRLEGHSSSVSSVNFSHDGKRVVSGSDDGTAKIWDVETGEEERKLQGHTFNVISVAFSHDGKKVVSGSHDRTIRIWNVETGEEERKLQGYTNVEAVAFSHDGKVVSGSHDRAVRVWNVETGEEERKLKGHLYNARPVAFSYDGKKVISGSDFPVIRIWNVETEKEESKLEVHSHSISSLAFSHDGKVAVGSSDGIIRIWNVETGEKERKLHNHAFERFSMAFSHDGKKLVCGSHNGTIWIWNVETREKEKRLEGHSNVVSVAFSHDGKKMASILSDGIMISNMETGAERKLESHSHSHVSVVFSHDKTRVVSGHSDGTIRIWNVETGEEERKLEGQISVSSVAVSYDRKKVVSGSKKGIITIWNVETGEEERKFQCHLYVISVAFSHDGKKVIFMISDRTIGILDVETGEDRKLEGHQILSWLIAFSHDGKKVAFVSHDPIIRMWNVDTEEPLRELQSDSHIVRSVAFSHDGKKVVSGSGKGIISIWNVETGEEERRLEGHSSSVSSVNFSCDEKKIVSGFDDGTARIWDVETGEEVRKLQGHTFNVISMAFSHDGKKVVSGSYDRTIRIWNVETGEEERKLENDSYTAESVVFSHDGKMVVYSSDDRTIRIWNVKTGEQSKLEGHQDIFQFIAFSHGGKKVIFESDDKTIRIWNVETGEEERRLEDHRSLSLAFSYDKMRVHPGFHDAAFGRIGIWNLETIEGMEIKQSSNNFILSENWISSSHSSATHSLWLPTRYQNFVAHATATSAICLTYITGQVLILRLVT